MSLPQPITASSVRGFNDHPVNKVIDSETDAERVAFRNWVATQLTPSMYTEGGDPEASDGAGGTVGANFLRDSFVHYQLMHMNTILIDAAAHKNDGWHHCYVPNPHISIDKTINLTILHGQKWSVTNTGSSSLVVYIRRYDRTGNQHTVKPVTIAAGSHETIRA